MLLRGISDETPGVAVGKDNTITAGNQKFPVIAPKITGFWAGLAARLNDRKFEWFEWDQVTRTLSVVQTPDVDPTKVEGTLWVFDPNRLDVETSRATLTFGGTVTQLLGGSARGLPLQSAILVLQPGQKVVVQTQMSATVGNSGTGYLGSVNGDRNRIITAQPDGTVKGLTEQ